MAQDIPSSKFENMSRQEMSQLTGDELIAFNEWQRLNPYRMRRQRRLRLRRQPNTIAGILTSLLHDMILEEGEINLGEDFVNIKVGLIKST